MSKVYRYLRWGEPSGITRRDQAELLRAAAAGHAVNGDVARARELRARARRVECRDGLLGDRRKRHDGR